MTIEQIKRLLEAAILISETPVPLERLSQLFEGENAIANKDLKDILRAMSHDYAERGMELQEVASGYRFQVPSDLAPQLLPWSQQERPARYSRAFLETLSLIAYRQPVTRAEIEDIRGVAVSSNIMRTLQERDWVKIVGHREVPGRPALYATTKAFLDYFNLKSLEELPPLLESKEDDGAVQLLLDLNMVEESNPLPLEEESELLSISVPLEEESELLDVSVEEPV